MKALDGKKKVEPCDLLETRRGCLAASFFNVLGRTTSWSPKSKSWSPKSKCVYGPENEIAAVFFAKNDAWRDAFFCVCVGMDRFVTIGCRIAQFCFEWGCVCRPEFSIIWLKNNSIHLKPDESFVYIGGVSIL